MQTVNFLAQIWGFSLLIISFAFLVRPQKVWRIISFMEDESKIMVSGIAGVVLGIILVLNYNVWQKDWTVVITLLNWAFLIKAIGRLFFPEFVLKIIAKIKNKLAWTPYVFLGTTIMGCALIYAGFVL